MKKFGFATIAAGGLAAAIVGLAAPAQAVAPGGAADNLLSASNFVTGIDHHSWLDQIGPHVNVPQVNTGVQQSR